MNKMRYRLAIDLGTTSLGWALLRLDAKDAPCAVIKAGVRIFSDGRNPKDGASLAVTRREARAMRRRRDRLLKRKVRLMNALVALGFFPSDATQCKALEALDPYLLRARGLDAVLTPGEFARAVFHLNQRRGFKSNRRTDSNDNTAGALKTAIGRVAQVLASGEARTVGEWLHKQAVAGLSVRARYRQQRVIRDDGKSVIDKSYDLYIDRAMVAAEFDALWAQQAQFDPQLFNETARTTLRDVLLFQRNLRPVKPGRCTLLPDEERAPLALPTTQRFRMLQELNNLRILRVGVAELALTLAQRDTLAAALERQSELAFSKIKTLLKLGHNVDFNFEDPKRQKLKGNATASILSKPQHFGAAWFEFTERRQDEIVEQLLGEQNEAVLVDWLRTHTNVDEATAEKIGSTALPSGYGSLSRGALQRIVPELRSEVITYDQAVLAAGFDHHSNISAAASGEILLQLPYYGEALQRHVGFGSNKPGDPPEKFFGRIANPTVHIALNQVRRVVNDLIARYGHPSEVIVELARDLKQSKLQREEENRRQADNQRRNARMRADISQVMQTSVERVSIRDIQKLMLWEELHRDPVERRCPYSGAQISVHMLLSDAVEIEHILPFSDTLDDSLANKTVALRSANRVKGNRTPWQAFGEQTPPGYDYTAILERVAQAATMPRTKRTRFAQDGYQRWLKDDKGFLPRALNDTRYMSRVAREYVSLICPQGTRVIPGRMTALLRQKFGLNDLLGVRGVKNRDDHRHHAVDACVIGVTDQGLMQRFARASADTRTAGLDRLVDEMPLPFEKYREHVARAVSAIRVSHRPDHSFEGAMHMDTAYRIAGGGMVVSHKAVDGVRQRVEEKLEVIEMSHSHPRHGTMPDGTPRPYKGYKGGSNYCIEIWRNEKGKWEGTVVSTFEAYQLARKEGHERLRHPRLTLVGKPLVMRLMINDPLRLDVAGETRTLRVATISANGQVFMCDLHEANVDARNRDRADAFGYLSKTPGTLQVSRARSITMSALGEMRDAGFRD